MELSDAAAPPKTTEKVGGNIKINLKSEPAVSVVPASVSSIPVPPADTADVVPSTPAPATTNAKPTINPVDIIHMSTFETPIHITNKNPKTYRNCSTFDRSLNKVGKFWDMIIIHHNNKYAKADILEACFKITGNADFYPVAYRNSRVADLFLLRLCPSAMAKLFQNDLRLLMPDGKHIDITVKFEVAEYKSGQVQIRQKLLKTLRLRRKSLISSNGLSKVLNFDCLAKDPEMNEIVVDFGSNAALALLTSILKTCPDLYTGDINGVLLSNNGIKHFGCFRILSKTYVQMMDISNNLVDSVEKIKGLEPFVFTEFFVTGNPFVQQPAYVKEIREAFPVIKKINGVAITLGNPNPYAVVAGRNAPPPPPGNKPSSAVPLKPPPPPKVVPIVAPKETNTPAAPPIQKAPSSLAPPPPPPPSIPTPTTEDSEASSTSATVTPAVVPFQIKVKSFAQVGGPPLGKDPKATSGGELTVVGKLIVSDDCQSAAFFKKYKSSTMWHRVVINHNGAHRKAEILTNMHKLLATTDIYPCYYMEYPKCDTFFVYNSYDALEQLVQGKLLLRMESHNVYCPLSLHMNVANFKPEQVDALEIIRTVIGKCFTLMDRTLDLTAFAAHPEFEHIEVNLSNPATISHVLVTAARRYFANIQTVRFCGNGLESTLGMRPLSWMTDLTTLDLSANSIPDMVSLESLPALPKLTELDLRGNPLGLVKIDPSEYVGTMKKLFPDLSVLDGQPLGTSGCSVAQRNYICSLDGFDLVEQFVTQYFDTYDANAAILKDLYQPNAIMTISCAMTGNDFIDKQLRKYTMRSRNLIKIISRPGADLGALPTYIGGDTIAGVWVLLGKTKHDLLSFTTDMIHYTDSTVVITVNGLFKEVAEHQGDDLVLGFVRTFVLRRWSFGQGMFGCCVEYRISNEQVLIYRPSMLQMKQAFPAQDPVVAVVDDIVTQDDKDGMVIMFQELSNLVPLWCIRFLEQASWNFKNALELFVHLCEDGQVPNVAFLEFSEKSLNVIQLD